MLFRSPHTAWPTVSRPLKTLVARALEAGVSLAVRGNLIILAPPLVIAERDLTDAVDLIDRLLAETDWS